MTVDQVLEELTATIEAMSEREKAQLRAALRKEYGLPAMEENLAWVN